jgi:hypothetical protein
VLSRHLFKISGIIGSRVEDRVPSGAICQFYSSESLPDAESRCRDVLAPMGYQVDKLLSQSSLTEERLQEEGKQLFDNYLLLGYALRFYPSEDSLKSN